MVVGIRRTYTNRNASPNADKIIIELTDGTSYKVAAKMLSGKTEEEINLALTNWLDSNRPELSGLCGVHINRDASFVMWTGYPVNVWPEDVTGTFG